MSVRTVFIVCSEIAPQTYFETFEEAKKHFDYYNDERHNMYIEKRIFEKVYPVPNSIDFIKNS